MHPNLGTEIAKELRSEVEFYRQRLLEHPIVGICADKALPRPLLDEFTKIQYVDSTLWVAMLSLAAGRVTSPRLKEAIRANILCEVGHSGTPHTTLCQRFVESLGLEAAFGDYQDYAPLTGHSIQVMNAFDKASEGVIAGWLLVAESLVPTLFSVFRPAYADIPDADLRYLDEHISVDADEHAQWMQEAAEAIAVNPGGLREVLQGINLGGRATLSVPDVIFAKTVSGPAYRQGAY